MGNIWAVTRRELGAYFDAPLAYFVVPAYVWLVGAFALWFDDLFVQGTATLRGVFFWSGVFLVLLTPAVTMRLFAEERRTGSIELLCTLPLTELEIVIGKYLAALAVVAVSLGCTLTYPATVLYLGTAERAGGVGVIGVLTGSGLDLGAAAAGYLGLFLMGAALTAVGTAASSRTSNQIVAFLVSLLISLPPFVVGFFLDRVPLGAVGLAQWLSFEAHLGNLSRGVVDTGDLVYFGGIIGGMLHVAVHSLEQRRLS